MTQASNPVFEIYTFPHMQKGEKQGVWTKYASANCRDHALSQAEKLFQSCKFHKVQVEEIYRDTASPQKRSKTLKVFQARQKWRLTFLGLLGVSSAFLGWAFMMLMTNMG